MHVCVCAVLPLPLRRLYAYACVHVCMYVCNVRRYVCMCMSVYVCMACAAKHAEHRRLFLSKSGMQNPQQP